MRITRAFWMSMGMFSVFPVPKNSWRDDCRPLVIPLFPLAGAVIGAAWYGLTRLFLWAGAPLVIVTAFSGLAPFFLSGCLHLDGWMDTADAVFSRRDLEERGRVLKDPHVGVFGAAALAFLFVIHFSAIYTLLDKGEMLTGLIFLCVVSRAATGLALLTGHPISSGGYMASFQRGTKPGHTVWLFGVLAATLTAAGFIHWKIALSCAVALLAALGTEKYLFHQLKGLSGDLCGCILTACEVCGLLCLALL